MRNKLVRPQWAVATAFVAFVGFASPVQAQFGIIGGANFAELGDIQIGNLDATFDRTSGFHLGVFTRFGSPSMGLRLGAIYLDAGEVFEGGALTSPDDFRLKYLAFPLDLQFGLAGPLYLLGGPEIQYLVSSGNSQPQFESELRDWVAKGGVGLGVQLGKVFLEGRYVFGLTGITGDTISVGGVSVATNDPKSNAVRLSAGINF